MNVSHCGNPNCSKTADKKCSKCHVKYCSKECQQQDWKHHKVLCSKTTTQQSQVHTDSTPLSDADLCYREISIEEEFYRCVESHKLETNFYWDVDKNRKRDRGDEIQSAIGNVATKINVEKMQNELKRQYIECVTLEPNDTAARRAHKSVIFSVISGLLYQMKITVFSPTELKTRQDLMENDTKLKSRRLVDLTEAVRLKHYPNGKTLSITQIKSINQIAESAIAIRSVNNNINVGRAFPPKRSPWYPGPPAWAFPEGLASLESKIPQPQLGFLFTPIQTQRFVDNKHRFYVYNYPKGHYDISSMDSNPLPFSEHCRLHRLGGASVTISTSGSQSIPADRMMSLAEFNNLVNLEFYGPNKPNTAHPSTYPNKIEILLPHVIVGACDYCGKPAVGECLCGECYCSVSHKHYYLVATIIHLYFYNCVHFLLLILFKWLY